MKMRLYIVIFVFIGALFFGTPCASAKDKLKVVTTFTVIADIAQNVAGQSAEVVSITKPGADIHEYQPTPQDIVRAQHADLILWNGLNLERWFERFLQDVKDVPSVTVTQNIAPLSIYEGPYSGKPNPHAWMSPQNGLIYVENIRQALCEADPQNAAIYTKNAALYSEKLKTLQATLMQNLQNLPPKKRILAASEGAFSYLARDLDMQDVYIWPVNADQQGTPQQVRDVIDKIRSKNVPVIFSESTISDKPARRIAAETDIIYGGVLYVDSLSTPDGPVPTYLDLLNVTTQTIAQGFNKAGALQP